MLKPLVRQFMMASMVALLGILLATVVAAASPVATTNYTFTTLNNQTDPTFNQLLGINKHGVIAGYFGSGADAQHPNKGYTLSQPYGQGNYTNENFPSSVQTQVTAINNSGDTAGFWVDGNGNNFGFVEWNGVFTSFQGPDAVAPISSNSSNAKPSFTQLLGINDKGIAVGFDTDVNGVNHGFKLNVATGKFTSLHAPNGGSNLTAAAINDNGDIAGFFTASDGKTVLAFLRKGKSYSEFGFPNSSNTTALGINKHDQIVGVYVDGQKQMHGFVLSDPLHNAKWQSIDDPNGIGATTINGINDHGDLVGFYVDAAGNTDGFLAQPVSQPTTTTTTTTTSTSTPTKTMNQQHNQKHSSDTQSQLPGILQWIMDHI